LERSEREIDNTQSQEEVTLLGQIFDKWCPIYMSYGMTYDEYWYDDCYKAYYYAKAYKEKLKSQDEFMWEQGMYVYEAILQCAPILHPFSKSSKPLPYTDKPHLHKVFMTEEEHKKNIEQETENERLKAYMWAKSLQRIYKQKDK
jgi:hypothetical protein